MNPAVQRADSFIADYQRQFAWYVENAGEEVAWRFFEEVDRTLGKLERQPDLGRLRRFRHSSLQGLRSFQVSPPFNRFLVFYRIDGEVIQVLRMLHGSRDLPHRLV